MSPASRTALICAAVVVAMTGGAFAAVPLYKAFCQATGFAGTVRKGVRAPAAGEVLDRTLEVSFDTNVNGVPWTFTPMQRRQTIRIGATNIAFFKVVNQSDKAVTARAAYNVSPDLAGGHVRKLQCFCFDAQTLGPHQTAEFPVIYFIEPSFASDPDTRGYNDITLSYTFVPAAPEKATTAALGVASRKPLGATARAGL